MNRSARNLSPTENWRSGEDHNGVYLSTHSSWSSTRPLFPPYVPARVVVVHPIYRQNPGEEVQDHWPSFQDRVTIIPFRVPGGVGYIPSQTLIPDNVTTTSNSRQRVVPSQSPESPRFDHQWSMQFPREESRLTTKEQNDALNKLKKETYYPTQKRVSKMPNLYYRNYDINNIRGSNNPTDEDGKRCSICLEDFEPKEVVTVTPCKHMFHEDCIVPWVKNHGRCPVCRFALYENLGVNNVAPSNNANADDAFERDMISMIRAMDQTFISERRGFLLP